MIKPYYNEEGITIYNADCRAVLPQLEPVDLVLTDPPYGIADKWKGGGGVSVGRNRWVLRASETHEWDQQPFSQMPLVLSKGRNAVIWGGNYYALPPSRCWLIWDKKTNDAFTTGQAEMAWTTLDRPIRVFRLAPCEAYGQMKGKAHPSQKPLPLIKWCLKWFDSIETVLDPFMGSGTTLVAAKALGLKAIGVEISKDYCDIAIERLRQRSLFASLPAPELEVAA